MKVLFVFCEGPHDAHFVGRLLKASGQYQEYTTPLKDYPKPLGKFISGKFQNRRIEDIRIGRPDNPLVPVCGLTKTEEAFLVFPISLGGMNKMDDAKLLLKEICDSFAPDILERPEIDVGAITILFIYDADSRGITETVTLWNERFSDFMKDGTSVAAAQWCNQSAYRIGLFVFIGSDGTTGTLEDNLIDLFRNKNASLLHEAESFLNPRFEAISQNGDLLAHETKKKKSILTTCGQAEKDNAGSALTVIIRDTKLLEGAFNFADPSAQWSQLLNFINGAFE